MSTEPEIAENQPEIAEKARPSELVEHRWAVISERGCEATRLEYDDAVQLGRNLKAGDVRGVCIVTETAASHLSAAKVSTDEEPTPLIVNRES
jgi:hypothetical protein